MRFFPWLSVFLLHRWKYKLSENNTILKLKITVLPQKLIIFGGLVNKYGCLLPFFHDTCAENVNITSMSYATRNTHDGNTKKYNRLCSGKAWKSAEYNPDKHYIFEDRFEDGWKRNNKELSETRFSTYTSNFIPFSVTPLHRMTWNYVLRIFIF